MQFRQVQVIAGRGSGAGKFAAALCSICIDRQDHLYAAGDSQVAVFDASGSLQKRWSLSQPASAIAVADDGSVYAGQSGQIEIFDNAGRLTNTWRDGEHLGEVTAIGLVRDAVLVADARDRCLRRYSKAGQLINNIGQDNRTNGFLIPNGTLDFSVDRHGMIHAANPGKHRVERYSCEGQLAGQFGHFDGRDPAGFPGCCNPTNITIGPLDRIYVTEKAGPRAKVLDSGGNLLAVIATDVFDPACKNMDIAVDSRGRVYVVDTVKLHILVFEAQAGAEAEA